MSGNIFLAVVSRGKNTTFIVKRQIWKKSSTRYTGVGKEVDSVSCKMLVRRQQWCLIPHSRCRSQVSTTMKSPVSAELYLLLLYLRKSSTYWWSFWCMYVLTVPTTVPTVRARTMPTAVQYVLTYAWTALLMYVRIYGVYWKKKGKCRIDRYLLHLHSVCTYCTYNTDVRTACTYCWCTHVYWKNYQLL